MPAARIPVNWPNTEERLPKVNLDLAGPIHGNMVLAVVDSHSKWIEAVPMRSATAEATISVLREIFSRVWLPRTVVTDNGTNITSASFAKFSADNFIQHLRTEPYHLQSNRLVERAVRTIKEGLKRLDHRDLSTRLEQFFITYGRTPRDNGESPSQRLLGHQIRARVDLSLPAPPQCLLPVRRQNKGVHAGDAVCVGDFEGNKGWTPGTVTTPQGSRMVTSDTPSGEVRRHLDQLRFRDANAEEPKTSISGPEPTSGAPHAAPSVVQESAATRPPSPRRSTRTKKPSSAIHHKGG